MQIPTRAWLIFAALFVGCASVSSAPCEQDADCGEGKCRRGACGPACLDDLECETPQVCRQDKCAPPPECARDLDCAEGFTCAAGRCTCADDRACALDQACVGGRCQARGRCRSDAECSGALRCEVTLGTCLEPCEAATDCAPSVPPLVAEVLYRCVEGACLRRCLGDATCGPGLICQSGTCAVPDCATRADCPDGRYCTSATAGRCVGYQPCATSVTCPEEDACRRFTPAECPPGFDCSQTLCLELPRCLADGDCDSPAYCEGAHCRPSRECGPGAPCDLGQACIAARCVPSVCRGLRDCATGQTCSEGRCTAPPLPADVDELTLVPRESLLQVGGSIDLTLIARAFDGSTHALSGASFEAMDEGGAPSSAATISGEGHLVAVSPGVVWVRASLPGAFVPPRQARVRLFAAPGPSPRVIVVDAASLQPISGATVRACRGDCAMAVSATTDGQGIAALPDPGTGPLHLSVASNRLRGDGLPWYERATVLSTSARDVLLPLWPNPVQGAAGFEGTFSFSSVSTAGALSAGFAMLSLADLPALDPTRLLGEPFFLGLPGGPGLIPVPGAAVLAAATGVGAPQAVKPLSYGVGEPGLRHAVAFAGRVDPTGVPSSLDLFAWSAAFDYAIQPGVTVPLLPRVADTADLDGDGRCATSSACPLGQETIPDYANLANLSFTPRRAQRMRTELVASPLPPPLDNLLLATGALDAHAGFLPLGVSRQVGGAPDADGARAVGPRVLQSGPPYAGLEVARPAVWALAFTTGGAASSGRLAPADTLPERAVIGPFLPPAAGSSYAPTTRRFSPNQPGWNAISSAGAKLARLRLSGVENRHTVYFAIEGSQTSLTFPAPLAGAGADPIVEPGAVLEVAAMVLQGNLDADALYTLAGPNLSTFPAVLEAYSRVQP